MCKYLMGGCKEERARVFSVESSERPREHKLKCRKFSFNTRKNCVCCVGDQILAQVAQGDFVVSVLGDLQNLTGRSPE